MGEVVVVINLCGWLSGEAAARPHHGYHGPLLLKQQSVETLKSSRVLALSGETRGSGFR